jgi:hypothetical protein
MSTAAQQQNKPVKPGQYEVARAGGKCVACQKIIEPGQKLMAALRETPAGFERLDVCLECWPTFDRKELLGFWQTILPVHEQKKKLFVDDQVLCELFERLADTTEQSKLNFRFVLGLILMRKRMLVYETTRFEDAREIWSVRFKGKDQKLDLLNPKLTEAQVGEVSQQLSEILNEEL